MFEQAQQQSRPDIAFLMVSDEPAAKIQAFIRKHPYGFTFLRVRRSLPGVNVRPITYTFDKSGELLDKAAGSLTADELDTLLRKL